MESEILIQIHLQFSDPLRSLYRNSSAHVDAADVMHPIPPRSIRSPASPPCLTCVVGEEDVWQKSKSGSRMECLRYKNLIA